MIASPVIKRLSRALRAVTSGGDPAKVAALARVWGIDGRSARKAASGKVIDANSYLKLCAAVGIEPVSDLACHSRHIPDIDWGRVGIKIMLALIGDPGTPSAEKLTMRSAAKAWKISLVVLGRMKAGQPASADNLLALCAALKCHPHTFLKLVPVEVSQKQLPEHLENTQSVRGAMA